MDKKLQLTLGGATLILLALIGSYFLVSHEDGDVTLMTNKRATHNIKKNIVPEKNGQNTVSATSGTKSTVNGTRSTVVVANPPSKFVTYTCKDDKTFLLKSTGGVNGETEIVFPSTSNKSVMLTIEPGKLDPTLKSKDGDMVFVNALFARVEEKGKVTYSNCHTIASVK